MGLSVAEACKRVSSSAETLLTSKHGFGLTTASLLQRGICRLAEGLPLADSEADVRAACGGASPAERPRELYVLSGIRTGKSMTAAALAIRATQSIDLSCLALGEIPRVSVVSLKRDLAQVIYQHIRGTLDAHAHTRILYFRRPRADSIMLKHPSGRPVEIAIVAGAKAGSSLVSRWSAGCILDECARMVGHEDGVANFDDARAAVIARMLPGAQLIGISSPWAPYGPIYDMYTQWYGRSGGPTIVKATGPAMNPEFWTPERCATLKTSEPDVWLTDCQAEFASPEENVFPSSTLGACVSNEHTQPQQGAMYVAAIDPATRGNAWTLCLGTNVSGKKRIILARQWIGSKLAPLSPRAVLREIADILRPYGVAVVESDQYSIDAIADIGREFGLVILARQLRPDDYMSVRQRMMSDEVRFVDEILPDLRRVVRRVTATGIRIVLPVTADGRHADFAPAAVLVLSKFIAEEQFAKPLNEVEIMRKRAEERWGKSKRQAWS